MSQSQDGSGNSRSASDGAPCDVEPADPATDACDHSARRALPLAPDTVKVSRLPDPFVEGGESVTVREAGETYLRVQQANQKDDALTSKYERARDETYPRILEADRHFQAEYDGLTTAMLTRRLSPLDDTDSWLTPWECNEMLHGGSVHRSVREAIAYQLGSFEYEWAALTAPTRSAGTPHEHIYLWAEDPDNEMTTDHLMPALGKHLKYCANAYEEHHRYQTDGHDGAITVVHDPGFAWLSPDAYSNVRDKSETYAEAGAMYAPTKGAQYLASQLAHLPLADFYDPERTDPPMALFEGAALAWASPRDWFRAGRGVPG